MQNDSMQERAVDVREYARLEGISASVVYRMIQQKVICCLRTGTSGRGIRIIPSEARAALRSRDGWQDPSAGKRGIKKDESAA